jgi:voltage-gated sodium channel
MLTLFILLTLENFPTYLAEAEAVSPYAVVFFVSYVLLAAFVVFNLLIGIVIGSMERAREQDAADAPPSENDALLARLQAVQGELQTIESELAGRLGAGSNRRETT